MKSIEKSKSKPATPFQSNRNEGFGLNKKDF